MTHAGDSTAKRHVGKFYVSGLHMNKERAIPLPSCCGSLERNCSPGCSKISAAIGCIRASNGSSRHFRIQQMEKKARMKMEEQYARDTSLSECFTFAHQEIPGMKASDLSAKEFCENLKISIEGCCCWYSYFYSGVYASNGCIVN